MKIEQKCVVGGEAFDTIEEAQEYVANNEDMIRIDAYTDFLRSQGAQRISKRITEKLVDFIKFEKGELQVATEAPVETGQTKKVVNRPFDTDEPANDPVVDTTEKEEVETAADGQAEEALEQTAEVKNFFAQQTAEVKEEPEPVVNKCRNLFAHQT